MSKQAPRFGKGAAKKGAAAKPAAAAKAAVALPQSPQQLEAVLAALLAPDTAAITAATEIMNAFMKQSAALPALMQQVAHSSVMESRQMAAVLLRRCITKLWKGLKPAEKTEVVRHTRATIPRTQRASCCGLPPPPRTSAVRGLPSPVDSVCQCGRNHYALLSIAMEWRKITLTHILATSVTSLLLSTVSALPGERRRASF